MSDQQQHLGVEDACVDFTYRVYSDGRRERFATVYAVGRDGTLKRGSRRPTGPLGRFVADAISEVVEMTNPRRVVIEPRELPQENGAPAGADPGFGRPGPQRPSGAASPY